MSQIDIMATLADAARGAKYTIDQWLTQRLTPQALDSQTGYFAQIDRRAFQELPEPLWPFALSILHETAGATYPASSDAHRELRRQLLAEGRVGCDCGDGWRWTADRDSLRLARTTTPIADFTYTFQAPGSLLIPELSMVLSLTRGSRASWMLRGQPHRAGIALQDDPPRRVTVRNRRPGDRIRPLGSPHNRRLKDLLIDRRVPRQRRGRLPLLVIDDTIAWVPGVTIDDSFRLIEGSTVWIAEIHPALPEPENPSPSTFGGDQQKGNEP